MNQSLEFLQSQVNHTVTLLESLGFTIKREIPTSTHPADLVPGFYGELGGHEIIPSRGQAVAARPDVPESLVLTNSVS